MIKVQITEIQLSSFKDTQWYSQPYWSDIQDPPGPVRCILGSTSVLECTNVTASVKGAGDR